jgi:hypothetical protein
MATLNLFLEAPSAPGEDLPLLRPKSDILLFFKRFCPDKEHPTLQYAGRRLVPKDSKIKVGGWVGGVAGGKVGACLLRLVRLHGWMSALSAAWLRPPPLLRLFLPAAHPSACPPRPPAGPEPHAAQAGGAGRLRRC